MRRILLASAAAMALTLAASLAVAQYPEAPPTPPPVEATPAPQPHMMQESPEDSLAPPATTAEPSMDPYASPAPDQTELSTQEDMTQTQTTVGTEQATAIPAMELTQHAQEAGMASLPMTAAEVCAPRSVSLAEGTSRLNTQSRRQLIFATDRASVCELQNVTIQSPDGRGEAVRQTLIDHGVSESQITVQNSADGELGVEMAFSGIAASSDQYAAMFDPVQSASLTPQPMAPAAPSTADETLYEPTAFSPDQSGKQDTASAFEPTTLFDDQPAKVGVEETSVELPDTQSKPTPI